MFKGILIIHVFEAKQKNQFIAPQKDFSLLLSSKLLVTWQLKEKFSKQISCQETETNEKLKKFLSF